MSHSYAYTLKLFHKNVDTLKIFCCHLSHSSNCFGRCAVRFCSMFLLTNLSSRSFDHEQKQTLLILKAEQRQKYVTSFKFLHLQYKNKDPRKTGHSCHTQVSGVCHDILSFVYFKQTCSSSPLHELVQHQILQTPCEIT